MRLFISINFDSETKKKIIDIQKKLQQYALKGNFSREDNLHLTLVFLGEIPVNKVDIIKKVINETKCPKFEICFKKIGVFKSYGSEIWWIGAEYNEILFNIQKQLSEKLTEAGFNIEKRKYSPHVTLARQVELNKDFEKSEIEEPFKFIAEKISLMKSERINGKLIYTEIQ